MSEFIQLHVLTSYPPANLNRDDLGRPKTAVFGSANRLRISSQSLKRAWRQSPTFEDAVGNHKGWRTREIGKRWVHDPMIEAGISEKIAMKSAQAITATFGKPDDDKDANKMLTKQLVHVSPEEKRAITRLVEALIAEERPPSEEETKLLRHKIRAADIALFGRMLADEPSFNVEAAVQVAHAISVHAVTIEDDYFTAVDDLNDRQDNVGAGHVGETEFAAGLFYLYLCIDQDSLIRNLQGDQALASKAIQGLVEAVCTIAPSGKQNSFASRAYASFVLAERGERQPRSLSVAFIEAIDSSNYVDAAVEALTSQRSAFDRSYGKLARADYTLDVSGGEGSIAGLLEFVGATGEAPS